jgi:hypothetical protein
MVGAGQTHFTGLVRSNKTAAFIVDCLKSETSREQIINAMAEKYDASVEVIGRDVDVILNQLRSIGALDE